MGAPWPALLLAASLALANIQPAAATPCCGPTTPDRQRLAAFFDASHVDQLWLAHLHALWRTGAPDSARPGYSRDAHCCAYAAAMAQRASVPLLHPPEHGQRDLANAQFQWLQTQGPAQGWRQIDFQAAQRLANQDYFVLAVFQNPNLAKPGHIAILRPSGKTLDELERAGPEEAQAGEHNFTGTSIAHGFVDPRVAWIPGGKGALRFFAHRVDWGHLPPSV